MEEKQIISVIIVVLLRTQCDCCHHQKLCTKKGRLKIPQEHKEHKGFHK